MDSIADQRFGESKYQKERLSEENRFYDQSNSVALVSSADFIFLLRLSIFLIKANWKSRRIAVFFGFISRLAGGKVNESWIGRSSSNLELESNAF